MPKAVAGVAVAVINAIKHRSHVVVLVKLCLCLLFATTTSYATVLPEERTDIFYSVYDGGGSEIDGPAILVRKNFKEKVSVWGHYFVDLQTSASIDVVTQGSPYEERRDERSVGLDYLHARSTMSLRFTNSSENDYEANTVGFGLSQDFFGDLTTLTLNYSRGEDTVRRNVRENGEIVSADEVGEALRKRFSLGLTQILTKNWMLALNVESVIDEGYLRNPYRSVRFLTPSSVGRAEERYPTTRNSDAFALRSVYYLPYRAALRLEYRLFSDSWGIEANQYELRYIQPYGDNWTFQLKYRYYSQDDADFYSELLPFQDSQEFFGSDKELSTYTDNTIGVGISYNINADFLSFFDKTSVNLYWDVMSYDYENFLDKRESSGDNPSGIAPGEERPFSFDANVVRLFFSFYY